MLEKTEGSKKGRIAINVNKRFNCFFWGRGNAHVNDVISFRLGGWNEFVKTLERPSDACARTDRNTVLLWQTCRTHASRKDAPTSLWANPCLHATLAQWAVSRIARASASFSSEASDPTRKASTALLENDHPSMACGRKRQRITQRAGHRKTWRSLCHPPSPHPKRHRLGSAAKRPATPLRGGAARPPYVAANRGLVRQSAMIRNLLASYPLATPVPSHPCGTRFPVVPRGKRAKWAASSDELPTASCKHAPGHIFLNFDA